MPVDASIYDLANRPTVPLYDPIALATHKVQMQNALAAGVLQQQQIQGGALDLQLKAQQIKDQAATRAAIQQLYGGGGAAPVPAAAPPGLPPALSGNMLAGGAPAMAPAVPPGTMLAGDTAAPAMAPAAGMPSGLPGAPAYTPSAANALAGPVAPPTPDTGAPTPASYTPASYTPGAATPPAAAAPPGAAPPAIAGGGITPAAAPGAAPPAAAPPARPRVPTLSELLQAGVPYTAAGGIVEEFQKIDKNYSEIDKNHAEIDKNNAELAGNLQKQVANMAHAAVLSNLNPGVMQGLFAGFASMGGNTPAGAKYQAMAAQVQQHLATLSPDDQMAYMKSLEAMSPEARTAGAREVEAGSLATERTQKQLQEDVLRGRSLLASTAGDKNAYAQAFSSLKPEVIKAGNFPAPANWTPTTAATIRQAGLTPEQQVTTAETAGYHKGELGIRGAELQLQREQTQSALNLSPEALNTAADLYNETGTLPAMGMGKAGAGLRSLIMNKAAERAGGVADLGAQRAAYRSDSASLVNLQKQRDSIGAFEITAGKNLDNFLTLSQKMVDTGSPLLNKPLRALATSALGSTDQAAVNAARQVAINEIAKITSNPNLSGALSDSARHEVAEFSPQDATLKQIIAVSKVLKQDMANRPAALDEQIDTVKTRMRSHPGATPAAPVTTAAAAPTVAAAPAPHGVPDLGSTFNGQRVTRVTRVQ